MDTSIINTFLSGDTAQLLILVLSGLALTVLTKLALTLYQKFLTLSDIHLGPLTITVARIKQLVVVVLSIGAAKLAALLHTPLDGNVASTPLLVLGSLVRAAVALGVHNVYKTSTPKAA